MQEANMTMGEQVEISSFDLRYEGCRMKNAAAENALLVSILEQGINEPLQGVDLEAGADINATINRILLDGFKRYRCAKKLNITNVPYLSLGEDEVSGLITLIRRANVKGLTILEQAQLIGQLKNVHQMSVYEIAQLLGKSKGWVGMRLAMIREISPSIVDRVLSGQFPAYSYMYTLRPFIRMNEKNKEEADQFVGLVSGKGLSIRDIDTLARGYFNGSEQFREQIKEGDILLSLNSLKESLSKSASSDCSEVELKMLKDLELTDSVMRRMIYKSKDNRFNSSAFFVQANLLSMGILKNMTPFKEAMEDFHDRSRKT
jgi:hypothetical protein